MLYTNHKQNIFLATLSLVGLFLFGQFFTNLEASAAKLIQIRDVKLNEKVLSLKHDSHGDIKFKKRVYADPPRLVFDILGSDLTGKRKTFLIQNSEIKEVRVGQFEPTVVRIVVQAKSLSALEKIKIENIGQNIFFRFAIQDVSINKIDFENGDLILKSSGPINYRKIFLENPTRLVVDLVGAKLKNGSDHKRVIKNGNEEIRIAKFDKSIIRIVFSGAEAHTRENGFVQDDNELVIQGKDQREKEETTGREPKTKKKLKEKILSLDLTERKDNESVFRIKSTKKIDYKFLKLHRPERLVLDLFNIAFEESLLATQFKETAHVKDVRFGLATIGTPVTRIVFDLKSADLLHEFDLSSSEKELKVKIIGEGVEEGDPSIPKAQKGFGKKVVIDPGHGGYDPGAVYGGHDEKDITLAVSKKLKKHLSQAGIKAYLTRSDDRFISLAERVEISNSIGPKLFVSVHANALATNTKMDGLQTYYYSRNGFKIASVTHKQLLEDVGMPNRNIRKARFWVTKYTQAPSILVEMGFMTNPSERKKLASKSYQDKLAKSLARGIIKYIEANSR